MISNEAQTSDADASEKQSQDQRSNFVYDFLYHDVRRIASFLAQFQDYGILQSIKSTESTSHSGSVKGGVEAGLSVKVIGHGKGAIDWTAVDDERDAAERTFDPLWTNAQTLLNYLESNSLISRDISTTGIGKFVLISGRLSVVDISIMRKIIENPTIKAHLKSDSAPKSENRHERRSHTQKTPSESELGLELISAYPLTVQASIFDAENSAWCSLREDCFAIPPGDLLLQHGVHIPGKWHMLGILDAKPDDDSCPPPPEAAFWGRNFRRPLEYGTLRSHSSRPPRFLLWRHATHHIPLGLGLGRFRRFLIRRSAET